MRTNSTNNNTTGKNGKLGVICVDEEFMRTVKSFAKTLKKQGLSDKTDPIEIMEDVANQIGTPCEINKQKGGGDWYDTVATVLMLALQGGVGFVGGYILLQTLYPNCGFWSGMASLLPSALGIPIPNQCFAVDSRRWTGALFIAGSLPTALRYLGIDGVDGLAKMLRGRAKETGDPNAGLKDLGLSMATKPSEEQWAQMRKKFGQGKNRRRRTKTVKRKSRRTRSGKKRHTRSMRRTRKRSNKRKKSRSSKHKKRKPTRKTTKKHRRSRRS